MRQRRSFFAWALTINYGNAAWRNPFPGTGGSHQTGEKQLPGWTGSGFQLQGRKTAEGCWTPTGSSSSESSLSPPSRDPSVFSVPERIQGPSLLAWTQSPGFFPKTIRLTFFCFPVEKVLLLQWGLARSVGSQAPGGLPSSLSACSKLSSWGLLSKGHISCTGSLELPTLNFVPYVVCGWRGLRGV